MWHLPWDRKPKEPEQQPPNELQPKPPLPPAEDPEEGRVDESVDESFPASDPPARH